MWPYVRCVTLNALKHCYRERNDLDIGLEYLLDVFQFVGNHLMITDLQTTQKRTSIFFFCGSTAFCLAWVAFQFLSPIRSR
jgi:hypothetical protein